MIPRGGSPEGEWEDLKGEAKLQSSRMVARTLDSKVESRKDR